jgi:hypothetical protein
MATTSTELIGEKVAEARATLVRHSEAVAAKAGVLLGFAGAFVLLALSSFSWWSLPGVGAATASAFACLAIFRPDFTPVLELRALRDRYARAEAAFTRRHVIDTEILMIEQQSVVVNSNNRWLRRAIGFQVLAIVLVILGTLADQLGG